MHTITLTVMELALNLIWLALALAGFALLGSNLSRAKERSARPPNNREKIIAMSCALIILFFVVSMTDDLHDQEVAVEESKLLRVASAAGSPSLASAHSVVTPAFLMLFAFTRSSLAFTLPSARRPLELLEISSPAAISRSSLCGRAPPADPA
jgi:hypothetical protein